MAFSPNEVTFLQRLVAERPARRASSRVATWFCDNHGIGVGFARHIEYQERHFDKAVQLMQLHQVPVVPLGSQALRADAAAYAGISEKSQSAAPSAGEVAVTAVGECALAGWPIHPPVGGYVVLTVAQACAVRADRLLVVENRETFRQLETYAWLDFQGLRVLVLFRGDQRMSAAESMAVVRRRTEPVWAFFDFDPAGLGMAAGLPRLERLLLPPAEWIERRAKGARAVELYDNSLAQWSGMLAAAEHAGVRAAWQLMKRLGGGLAQEAMRDAPKVF